MEKELKIKELIDLANDDVGYAMFCAIMVELRDLF